MSKYLTKKENDFLLKAQKFHKKRINRWPIFGSIFSILVVIPQASIGFISAFTKYKYFDYETFAACSAVLWIGSLIILIMAKIKEEKYLLIIKKLSGKKA